MRNKINIITPFFILLFCNMASAKCNRNKNNKNKIDKQKNLASGNQPAVADSSKVDNDVATRAAAALVTLQTALHHARTVAAHARIIMHNAAKNQAREIDQAPAIARTTADKATCLANAFDYTHVDADKSADLTCTFDYTANKKELKRSAADAYRFSRDTVANARIAAYVARATASACIDTFGAILYGKVLDFIYRDPSDTNAADAKFDYASWVYGDAADAYFAVADAADAYRTVFIGYVTDEEVENTTLRSLSANMRYHDRKAN